MQQTNILAAVNGYMMPTMAQKILQVVNPLVLCGVTAAGKNRVADELYKKGKFERVVTHTTRKPRSNDGKDEQNGVDYWFVDNAQMLQQVNDGQMVEVQAIHGDTFYGTSVEALHKIARDHKRPVLEPDIQGALSLIKAVPGLSPVFIIPPSFEVWMERLGTRGNISDGDKERRLHSARTELETVLNSRQFLFLINQEASQTALEIIQGVSADANTQHTRRLLAEELLQYVQNT